MKDLNRIFHQNRLKVFFHITCAADLAVMRGVVHTLQIQKRHVAVRCEAEATRTFVKSRFDGCLFTTRRRLLPGWIPVRFDLFGPPVRVSADGGLVVNYDPYKYLAPVRRCSRVRLRRRMGVREDRKIMVASCSHIEEIKKVLTAWQELCSFKKPLLVIGLRTSRVSLKKILMKGSFKIHFRHSPRQSLSAWGESDLVALLTNGELFDFMKGADLAVVGHDRNLFEPALQGVPSLYFARPLNMAPEEERLAKRFKLFWRKNHTAKKLLDRFGGATRINPNPVSLTRQIHRALQNPRAARRGARKAVEALRREVIPLCRELAAPMLAGCLHRRIKISCSRRTH